MNLISFGCSFIYGSDLADDGCGLLDPLPDGTWQSKPSQLTWPALVSKKLGYNYKSYALPGIGNLQIANQVLNQLAHDCKGLYVISWTWIDRFDYIDSKDNTWQTLRPTNTATIAKNYYRDYHSQLKDKLTTLMYIKLVIDTLIQKEQPFIMTHMDDLLFETEWHTSPVILEMQSYLQWYLTTFEGKTFLEWSRTNKFPESPNWHPLEQAHQAAADYILELGVHKV